MRPTGTPRSRSVHIATALRTALVALVAAVGVAAPANAAVKGSNGEKAKTKTVRVAPHLAAYVPGQTPVTRPTAWCGTEQSRDDLRNQSANGKYRFHAIYMVAADAPSRFGAFASQIQAGAFEASGLIERLYGRALRFDMGTRCGAQYLDITAVRSQLTTAQLAAQAQTPEGTLGALRTSLDAAGFPVMRDGASKAQVARLTENFVVWLDGPAPAGSCGQAQLFMDATRGATNWSNFAGKVSAVYLRRGGEEFCGARAVRHEMAHTLGAVQPQAPNFTDGAHCGDAYEDTMCVLASPSVGGGRFQDEYFDYGNDDYWDPPSGKPLKWWTLNLSRFICPDTACSASTPPVGGLSKAPSPKRVGRVTP